jgi:hypothetical protein
MGADDVGPAELPQKINQGPQVRPDSFLAQLAAKQDSGER